MRVLIVKMSSLGDVIHTLPALTDAARAIPNLEVDWVVEEAFAEIPSWHPAVDKVIPAAFRRWRKAPMDAFRAGEYRAFRKNLRARHYDLIIDAQGLLKSGLVSVLARGDTAGLDRDSIKESIVSRFYKKNYHVTREWHAVERVRSLFSQSLGYEVDHSTCDYGLAQGSLRHGVQEHRDTGNGRIFSPAAVDAGWVSGNRTLVFLHGTTWKTKEWPLRYWRELARLAGMEGYRVQVLWGNHEERDRANAIQAGFDHVEVLDRMSLSTIARLLASSSGVVAVDTGLAHLAAALAVPTVALYGPTDLSLTGIHGQSQLSLSSSLPCAPCLSKTCLYVGPVITDSAQNQEFRVEPPCFAEHPPEQVWRSLADIMSRRHSDC